MAQRFLYTASLGLAVASLLAAAFLIVERLDRISLLRADTFESLAYSTSQADLELMRLLDTLTIAADPGRATSQDAVDLAFELALGRVLGMTEGRNAARLKAMPVARDAVAEAVDLLLELEPQIAGYRDLSPPDRSRIRDRLREMAVSFHVAVAGVPALGDLDERLFYESLERNAKLEIGLLFVIFAAGSVTVSNTLRDRRRVMQRNRSLEAVANARTAELAAANEELRREVGERKTADDEAQRQRRQLEQAARLVTLGYYIRDRATGRFDYCSDAYAALFGRDPDDLVADSMGRGAVLQRVLPEDRAQLLEAYARLDNGAQVEVEYRCRAGGDGGLRHVQEIVQPIAGDDGNWVMEIGTTLDLTDKRSTESQLQAAQKLESIGQLTGGIAHDFNNLLEVILGSLEALQDDFDAPNRQALVASAMAATERGAALTKSLLGFARQARLAAEPADLNDLVQRVQGWLLRTIPENIVVRTRLADGLWPVRLDVNSTESALLNLVINARDAMPDGGTLTISTANVEIGTGRAGPGALQPGRYVELSVRDTGTGIADDRIGRVFDPFYTTKAPGAGSGLGLSMVQGFVRRSGGEIEVESGDGEGACFRLYFPAAAPADPVGPRDDAGAAGGSPRLARILVAEDEPEVRAILRRSLEARGHDVATAESGDAALAAFLDEGPFDLLITDVVMPGTMQGPALVRVLREIQPGLPAIYLSGYSRDADRTPDDADAGGVRLMKPIKRADLYQAVDAVLRGNGDA